MATYIQKARMLSGGGEDPTDILGELCVEDPKRRVSLRVSGNPGEGLEFSCCPIGEDGTLTEGCSEHIYAVSHSDARDFYAWLGRYLAEKPEPG